jgi:hypothetical protein
LLRFILGLVTIGIVVFCLVYFLWPLDTEKPSVTAAATVRQNSSPAAATAKAKAKSKGGEGEDDDDNDSDENNTEESEEDALQEQRRELRMNR